MCVPSFVGECVRLSVHICVFDFCVFNIKRIRAKRLTGGGLIDVLEAVFHHVLSGGCTYEVFL